MRASTVKKPPILNQNAQNSRTNTINISELIPSVRENQTVDSQTKRGGNKRHRVLLLNATYEPLTAVSVRRAVILILRERADLVHDDPISAKVASAKMSMSAPLVIRLRTYVRIPYNSANIPLTRSALMHRDDHKCGYCGAKADTIDHVIPRSRGGKHSWENTVACCANCNRKKADKLLTELGWKLKNRLEPPKDRYWRLLSSFKEIHPSWDQYLRQAA